VTLLQLHPTSSKTDVGKKLAGSHGPSPYRSTPYIRGTTATDIGELAEASRYYYEEKLKMKQAEHQLRMHVLNMKLKYYIQKLPG